MIRRTFCAGAVLLNLVMVLRAQGETATIASQFDRIVDAAFNAARCPGLSVAICTNNVIIYSKALGFADIEQNVPLRTDSAQRLASLSKPVTGTIIMDLVQSGRLNLDTPVRSYLAELPAAYAKVTLRHLLSHQAGVRDYRDLEEVFSTIHYRTSRDALRAFMNDPLLFEAGTQTAYSTFGFTVVGAVAEAATRKTFQEISKEFFRRYSIQRFDLDDPQAIVTKRVRGYFVNKDGEITNTRAYDASNKYPGGGFTASAQDYLRFVIAVASGRVLQPETLRRLGHARRLRMAKTARLVWVGASRSVRDERWGGSTVCSHRPRAQFTIFPGRALESCCSVMPRSPMPKETRIFLN